VSQQTDYTYTEAGFNGFFRRTIANSDPQVMTLREMPARSNQINFDYSQVSGALGDILRLGTAYVDGKTGRFGIKDDQGNDIVWLGKVDG
jgi:hypothetical protein